MHAGRVDWRAFQGYFTDPERAEAGIELILRMKILREDSVTAHIPIVALSANAMPRDIAIGLEAGFFRYLTKPIKVKEFMDTLNAALQLSESAADQRIAASA